mgnify:CR=1 FL=1
MLIYDIMTLEVGTLHEMVVKNVKKNTVYLIPEIEKVVVFNDDPKCVITFGNESVVFDVDSNVIFLRMNTQWTPNVSLQETMLNDIMILYRKIPTETYLFQEMTFVSATHETFTILMANTHTNLDEMRRDFAFKTIRFAYGEFENVLKSANITIDTTMEFSNMNKKIEYTCIVEYVSSGVIADLFVYNTSQAFKLPDTKEKGAFYILKMFPVTNKVRVEFMYVTDDTSTVLNTNQPFVQEEGNHDIHVRADRTRTDQHCKIYNVIIFPGHLSTNGSYAELDVGTRDNIFIGSHSGFNNDTGRENLFIGHHTGKEHVSGNENIFIGHEAGRNDTTGEKNIFLGPSCGKNNKGLHNVFIGDECGIVNEEGTDNVFIGNRCGFFNKNGSNNVFIGKECGFNNNDGNSNVFIGDRAGYHNKDGSYNMIIGNNDNMSDVNSISNIGFFELSSHKGLNFNTVVGSCTATQYVDGSAIGNNNTFVGALCAFESNINTENTLIGSCVAPHASCNEHNTFMGALICSEDPNAHGCSYGNSNSVFGTRACQQMIQSNNNVFMGSFCGNTSKFVENSISIGTNAARSLHHVENSISIGVNAGSTQSNVSDNIYIGNDSGKHNENGSRNIMIGHRSSACGHNNILLGHDICDELTSSHNKLAINHLISGDFEKKQLHVHGDLYVNDICLSGVDDTLFINGKPIWRYLQYKSIRIRIHFEFNLLDNFEWCVVDTGLEEIDVIQRFREDSNNGVCVLKCKCILNKCNVRYSNYKDLFSFQLPNSTTPSTRDTFDIQMDKERIRYFR